jgi:tetratricopeptide (TPR) repeat protein
VAGRMDSSYGDRLAALDWRDFYAKRGGALAVETLRKQLVGRADIVLVDSRTGFTDAGGICTVQLPDGVVLMTAPNKQSLAGIERVAETIARARGDERAGRKNIRLWLSVCRVPSVEESYRADAWFKEQAPRFDEMIQHGVLLEEDHRRGLRSYEIPHRARWGFEEALVTAGAGAESRDALWLAYEGLTVALLQWSVGPFDVVTEADAGPTDTLDELREDIAAAERREDVTGLLMAYVTLGRSLESAKQYDEAAEVLRRAATIAVGANLQDYHAAIKSMLGSILQSQGHHEEAIAEETSALEIARKIKNDRVEAGVLFRFARMKSDLKDYDGARQLLTMALDKMRVSGDEETSSKALRASVFLHALMTAEHRTAAALEENARLREEHARLREELRMRLLVDVSASYRRGDREREARALEKLIELSADGTPFPEDAALRARLAELQGAGDVAAPPPPPSPSKPKPSPSRRKPRPV